MVLVAAALVDALGGGAAAVAALQKLAALVLGRAVVAGRFPAAFLNAAGTAECWLASGPGLASLPLTQAAAAAAVVEPGQSISRPSPKQIWGRFNNNMFILHV